VGADYTHVIKFQTTSEDFVERKREQAGKEPDSEETMPVVGCGECGGTGRSCSTCGGSGKNDDHRRRPRTACEPARAPTI
jgi:hypothetical protein